MFLLNLHSVRKLVTHIRDQTDCERERNHEVYFMHAQARLMETNVYLGRMILSGQKRTKMEDKNLKLGLGMNTSPLKYT